LPGAAGHQSGFWPVGHLGFIVYDDPIYVGESIGWAFTTTYAGNWHPLTWLSHMLDFQLFGLNARGPHWVNLGFHMVNTLLLFLLLSQMTGAVWRSASVAALFACHPLHIQSVAWVSERKDLLSGFFAMLTLWAYTRFAQKSEVKNQAFGLQLPTSGIYWLALLFFMLGLMSKPMLVTVPIILLLLDFWPLGRWQPLSPDGKAGRFIFQINTGNLLDLIIEKLPFLALILISCFVTLQAQSDAGFVMRVETLPWYVRFIISPVFYTAYLEKLFWPENMSVFYPYPQVPAWQLVGSGLLMTGLLLFCIRQARSRPYVFVGWLWFVVMLLPVIGLVQVGSQSIADRYTYLPSIGLFIAVVWGVAELAASSSLWRTGKALGAIVVILACVLDTRFQLRYWRDSITLFSHALDVTRKNNYMSYYGLGTALWESGNLDGAVKNYRSALQIYPDFIEASSRLGYVLLLQKKPAEAEIQFKNVLQTNPSDTKAHKNLGDALAAQGKLAEAEAEYSTVLQLNPGNTVIYEALKPDIEKLETDVNLTNLYEALKIQPTPETHVQIAAIKTTRGEFQDAIGHYLAALHLTPDSPAILNNLAWLLATCQDGHIRDGTQAIQYAERACELTQYKQIMLLGTLAAAYAEAGRFNDAVATAQKACDLAAQQGETNLLQKNQELLGLYREHKPYRE
jgi:tetratricopeptide (TPR) repeat protein